MLGSWTARPVFTLTSDQDWAPEWATARLLALARSAGVPLHVFRTSPSALLDEAFARGEITQGWHPNFQSGSTHGATVDEVIASCRRLFGAARTVRSHSYYESSPTWVALARAGIVADSQVATRCQAGLFPLDHWTGIARLPVFLEDDCFFLEHAPGLSLESVLPTLFAPGLKVLDFHPIHVACNTPDEAHYLRHKARLAAAEPASGVVHPGRGTRVLLEEIVSRVAAEGHAFVSFEALVDEVLASRAPLRPRSS